MPVILYQRTSWRTLAREVAEYGETEIRDTGDRDGAAAVEVAIANGKRFSCRLHVGDAGQDH
jgi:hypothetical protein